MAGPPAVVVRSLYRTLYRSVRKVDLYPFTRGAVVTEPSIRPFVDGLKFFLRSDSCVTLLRRTFDDKRRLSPHASIKAVDVGFAVMRVFNQLRFPFHLVCCVLTLTAITRHRLDPSMSDCFDMLFADSTNGYEICF